MVRRRIPVDPDQGPVSTTGGVEPRCRATKSQKRRILGRQAAADDRFVADHVVLKVHRRQQPPLTIRRNALDRKRPS